MHDKGKVGTSKGASKYSPGDRTNDRGAIRQLIARASVDFALARRAANVLGLLTKIIWSLRRREA
jgi:hypothetical protein